jgi:competence protein ComEA
MLLRFHHSRKVITILAVVLYLGSLAVMAQTPAAPKGKAAKAAQSAPVNINQATPEQLTLLPGIGQVMAKRIVEFRQKNGPFKKVEDLLAVRGIGEKSLARMRSFIVL